MPLTDYASEAFTHEGITHEVFHRGEGPCVVVAAEIPGITTEVTRFADDLVAAGFSVAMPSMFGTPGKRRTTGYVLASAARACISREFHVLATKDSSPGTEWLRALARSMHGHHGGPGVGFVGMCFTGGFGLAMLLDDAVVAPVLSQPSLPFGLGAQRKASVGLDEAELERAAARAASGCPVMGLRFTGDPLVPEDRFATLRNVLGDNFIGVEVTSPDTTHGIDAKAHSVLTEERSDEVGHPTKEAFDRVIAFLDSRLHAAG